MTAHSKTLGLIKGQIGFIGREMDVILVAKDTGNLRSLAEEEGVAYRDIEMCREISPVNDLRSLFNLWRLFREEKPDIVHANTPKGALLGMMAAKLAGVHHRLYNVNGLRFETAEGGFRKLLITMERVACKCATKVIPQSNGVKDVLIREKITKKPMDVIHNGSGNGVDVDYYDPSIESVRSSAEELNNREDLNKKVVFVFVGRIVGDKGVNELVEAFDRLSGERGDIALRLLGNFESALDPVKSNTLDAIEKNASIFYEGYQNDIRPFLAASSVLVLPSYREGFPNVVLQAAAMGLPCIVSDVNGAMDVISNGENGIIVPKRDLDALYRAMKQLAEDNALRRRMSKKARSIVIDKFRSQDIWNATLEMYRNL